MKRILVPCDFSELSREALTFASGIASVSGGEIMVLRVIEMPFMFESAFGVQPYIFDPQLLKGLEDNARSGYEKMMSALGLDTSRASFHVLYGPVTPMIRNFIRSNNNDLVVMGTHGAEGMKEFFVGSNTEKIVRFSPVPVLSVKKAPAISSIKNIVLASTLDLGQDEWVVKVKELQTFFNAQLHILFVNTPLNFKSDDQTHQEMQQFVEKYKISNYTLNVRNDTVEADAIIDFAREMKADMIAMATHGRRGLMHLLTGSVAEDVVNHADYPIWTYDSNRLFALRE